MELMQCLNKFAPAIQAVSAFFIALLTGAIVFLTCRYVRVSEALQKPCVAIQTEPRVSEDAIADGSGAQVSQQNDFVVIENIGTGPALKICYRFQETKAQPSSPTWHPKGFVDYIRSGQPWKIAVSRADLATRNCEFEASYESLSGKKHRTRVNIENRRITSFDFK